MNRSYLYLCSATDIDCDVTACSDVVGSIELGVHIALDAHLSYQNFVIFFIKICTELLVTGSSTYVVPDCSYF